ncbi:uncharacterized protein LOC112561030 [Pomacea canaliculata]|uniref:uncharacterized protein LOC112561030 n=1 Tax=Pomacea canaliculata TaxID=400727 RepID=UPI000D729CEB|nr:uncharacterized protein LOC112561030 [Pomacea canaliculata]
MSTSDTTLYGLEMPSEEAMTMSTSFQKEVMWTSDLDSDRTQPPTEVTFKTDEPMETSTELKTSGFLESTLDFTAEEAPEVEAAVEEREPEEEEALEDGEGEFQEIEPPESPIPEDFEDQLPDDTYEQPYKLDPGSVYPGKRALELEIPEDIISCKAEAEEKEEFEELEEEDVHMLAKIGSEEYEEEPDEGREVEDILVEDENLLGVATGGDEEFMEQEAEEIEFMEKPEEELMRLKDTKPEDEEEEEESVKPEESSLPALLTVQGYDDLERPLSPTPDAFRQMFFASEPEKDIEKLMQALLVVGPKKRSLRKQPSTLLSPF